VVVEIDCAGAGTGIFRFSCTLVTRVLVLESMTVGSVNTVIGVLSGKAVWFVAFVTCGVGVFVSELYVCEKYGTL
jgi:hypothetical protein